MNVLSAIVGLVLLLFGRRMFWLFVATAGFAAGTYLAQRQFHLDSQWMVLAIALLAGLLGALLSVLLQKAAVAVAGFAAGAYLCSFIFRGIVAERFVWIPCLVGAIAGMLLLLTVFEWSLILLSAMVGAALLADGIGTTKNALLIFGVALALGVIIQAAQLRHAHPTDERRARPT